MDKRAPDDAVRPSASVGDSRPVQQASVSGHSDFRRLWSGLAVSQLGSAVGMVALPVIAVTVLGASAVEVTIIAACTAVTVALVALPVGKAVESRRKRPVMIAADVGRFLALASIPVTWLLGALTIAQLCLVAAVNALGQVMFRSASLAHTKDLVGPSRIVDANSRLESTQWLGLTVGPSLGGGLTAVLGPFVTVAVDAASFVASATAVRSIKVAEGPPPEVPKGRSRWADLLAGASFAWQHGELRRMLIGWVIFAGGVGMLAPASIIFYLDTLHFSSFQYGLLLGLPSIGGLIGARLSSRAVRRLGLSRTVYLAGLLRAPWQFLIPLAAGTYGGLVMCLLATFGVLFFSAMTNSALASIRATVTPDHLMSRVSSLWAMSTTIGQPLFVVIGGSLTALVGARTTLFASAAVMLAGSLAMVPWAATAKALRRSTTEPSPAKGAM